ncbi:Phospholipase/carboxylesterase [Amanita muscaria]
MPDLTISSENPYLPYFPVSPFYQVLTHEGHRHGFEKPYFAFSPFYHRHTATVICLDGTMHDGSKAALGLSLHPLLGHVKVILLPCTPIMPVTGDGRRCTPSWSDSLWNQREDEQGLFRAVDDIIQSEQKAGIPPHRIIIGGLSQGGALAILTGLTTAEPLAGVFLLSAYLPLRRKVPDVATKLAAHLPLFWGHGKCDGQVKYDIALASAKQLAADLGVRFRRQGKGQTREDLEKNGIDGLRFHSYPSLEHRIAPDELDDLVVWTAYLLPDIKL